MAYVSQKVKEARYKFNEEELRPFFSLPRVLEVRVGIAQAGSRDRADRPCRAIGAPFLKVFIQPPLILQVSMASKMATLPKVALP